MKGSKGEGWVIKDALIKKTERIEKNRKLTKSLLYYNSYTYMLILTAWTIISSKVFVRGKVTYSLCLNKGSTNFYKNTLKGEETLFPGCKQTPNFETFIIKYSRSRLVVIVKVGKYKILMLKWWKIFFFQSKDLENSFHTF